ncbi:polysaccharide deacetylase family protein [Weeksellaceae bacterium TAE3-ERU29]|nr:polysaccharide deacetylase family protein [Weeksellaceae bacterium TAE3-ERU29]
MKHWFIYIFSIFFLFSCTSKKEPIPNKEKAVIEEEAPKVEVSLGDEILIQSIKMGADSSTTHFFAFYPQTKYDFINGKEANFAQDFLSEFKKASAKGKDSVNTHNKHLEFYQDFDILQQNDKVLVFIINRYTTENNVTTKKLFTHYFDLKNKKQLTPENFFKDYKTLKEFSKVAIKIAQDSLRNLIQEDKSINKKNKNIVFDSINNLIIKESEPVTDNYKNIIKLPNGNWKLIFNKYTIPNNTEALAITIPNKIIAEYLKPEFLELMNNSAFSKQEKPEIVYNESNIDCDKVPCVALTFNDGPSAYTPEILDILKENNVKATFFILGKSAQIQYKTLQRAFEEGHEIENNTWDHKNLVGLSPKEIKNQVEKTDSILLTLIGKESSYLRPPYGALDKNIKSVVKKPFILWSTNSLDLRSKDTQAIIDTLSNTKPGTIILADDTQKETVDAISQVIKNLKAKGIHFVTVKKLFEGQNLENGKSYDKRNN